MNELYIKTCKERIERCKDCICLVECPAGSDDFSSYFCDQFLHYTVLLLAVKYYILN